MSTVMSNQGKSGGGPGGGGRKGDGGGNGGHNRFTKKNIIGKAGKKKKLKVSTQAVNGLTLISDLN